MIAFCEIDSIIQILAIMIIISKFFQSSKSQVLWLVQKRFLLPIRARLSSLNTTNHWLAYKNQEVVRYLLPFLFIKYLFIVKAK